MSHLEYMQSEASKNWEFHLQNMDNLQRESNTTLTFLYVVISASFSAALKLFLDEKFIILAVTLSFLCIYLVTLAVWLLFGCMMARSVKAPANEPKNLKIPDGYTSEQIQQFELENLQERIEYNANRNSSTARQLNRVRVAICFSPIVFVVVLTFIALLWAAGCHE
ncbi:MAG TPA: hypothetical protein VE344_01345 [Methylomirabilota bacterium]|nr:hypothetical protein [Methylomirabilota bacterium]